MPKNDAVHLIVDTDYLDIETLTKIKSICEENNNTYIFAIGNGSGQNNHKVNNLVRYMERVQFASETVDCKPEAADTHIIFLIQRLCQERARNIMLITRDRKLAEMAKRTGEIFWIEVNIVTPHKNHVSSNQKRLQSDLILSSAWQWLLSHPKCGHQVPKNALQKIVQSANLPVNDRTIDIAREAIAYARQKQAKFNSLPYGKPAIGQQDEIISPAPPVM